jgi:hypothetical protein
MQLFKTSFQLKIANIQLYVYKKKDQKKGKIWANLSLK